MLRLNGSSATTWIGDPFVARVTTNRLLPRVGRSSEALLLDKGAADVPDGFACYIRFAEHSGDEDDNGFPRDTLMLPQEMRYIADGDVLRIDPQRGTVRVLYRRSSGSNSILLTERCNSNCVMCSQPPRDHDDSHIIRETLDAIPLISPATRCIGLTGGEPTLLGNDFLRIVRACREYLPNTAVHVLSNGRAFRFLPFCQQLAKIQHHDLMLGIPVYSDIAWKHDFVVQAQGVTDHFKTNHQRSNQNQPVISLSL